MPSNSMPLRAAGCDKLLVETASGTRTDRPELAKAREQARQRAVLDESKIRVAKAMFAFGNLSAIEVAQQLGCARSTLYRHTPDGRSAIDVDQAVA